MNKKIYVMLMSLIFSFGLFASDIDGQLQLLEHPGKNTRQDALKKIAQMLKEEQYEEDKILSVISSLENFITKQLVESDTEIFLAINALSATKTKEPSSACVLLKAMDHRDGRFWGIAKNTLIAFDKEALVSILPQIKIALEESPKSSIYRSDILTVITTLGFEAKSIAPTVLEIFKTDLNYEISEKCIVFLANTDSLSVVFDEIKSYKNTNFSLEKEKLNSYFFLLSAFENVSLTKEHLPFFVELIDTNHAQIQNDMIKILGQLGEEAANVLPRLFLLLEKSNDKVLLRTTAATIKKIGITNEYIPTLKNLISSENQQKKIIATELSISLGSEASFVIPFISDLLAKQDIYFKQVAMNAIDAIGKDAGIFAPDLAKILKEFTIKYKSSYDWDDENMVKKAKQCLISIGEEGTKVLISLLNDENKDVRNVAISTIRKSPYDISDDNILLNMLQDEHKDNRYYTLKVIFDKKNTIEPYINTIVDIVKNDDYYENKICAIEILGKFNIKTKDALDSLEIASNDSNEYVQEKAKDILKNLTSES